MEAYVLRVVDKAAKLSCGIWTGGKGVTYLGEVDIPYRLTRPSHGFNDMCPVWSLDISGKYSSVVVINETYVDVGVVINGEEYKVPYGETKSFPTHFVMDKELEDYLTSEGIFNHEIVKMAQLTMHNSECLATNFFMGR